MNDRPIRAFLDGYNDGATGLWRDDRDLGYVPTLTAVLGRFPTLTWTEVEQYLAGVQDGIDENPLRAHALMGREWDDGPRPITISDLADHLLGRPATTGGDFEEVGLPMFGGCRCTASIACYNAYPGRGGFLVCRDCMSFERGWFLPEIAAAAIFDALPVVPTP